MRINKYIALATGMSRREADTAVASNRVIINGELARAGSTVHEADSVMLDDANIRAPQSVQTIILHKPVGYVVSREGQGSKTIYDLLPPELHNLKPVGRLDKDSSGLLVLTNDGDLAHQLTHPSFQKEKVYEITLDRELSAADCRNIETGIALEDGVSALQLNRKDQNWIVTMSEGRNRQIRRTFSAAGYRVISLHRTQFGNFRLNNIAPGKYLQI